MPPRPVAPAPLSYSGALVLQAIQTGHRHGFDIMRATGLPSGSVYPLLRRLEAAGLVASRWEHIDNARDEARPPRRYYTTTADGRAALGAARARVLDQQTLFSRRGEPARGRS